MKIKRYTAVSMRAALAQVRAEQGPDAVILSSRRNEEGIEVIAAVDYDEALFTEATRQRVAAPDTAPAPKPVAAGAAAAPPAPTRAASLKPVAAPAPVAVAAPVPAPVRAAAPAPALVRAAAPAP